MSTEKTLHYTCILHKYIYTQIGPTEYMYRTCEFCITELNLPGTSDKTCLQNSLDGTAPQMLVDCRTLPVVQEQLATRLSSN